ncbi:MAG: radical SAM protein [Sandaracinaceae bacterium]
MALLDVILGYDCNLACDYCTITPAMRARSLNTRDVLNAMRDARARGYEDLSLTGGEPTIRGDLLGLVRAGKKLGFADIKVQSNGLLYTPDNVARLVDAGASTFHVSIHTHLATEYDTMVRREGAFGAMQRGLEALVAAGVNPVADVILTSATHPRLPGAIAWLADRGLRGADLWFVSLTDGNADNTESLPAMTDVVDSIRQAVPVAEARDVRLRSLHLPRCLLGDLVWMAYDPAAERVMVVTPDDRFELSGSKLTPQMYVPACDGCPERDDCRGVRPDYVVARGDAEIAAARGQLPTRRLEVL